MGLQPPLSQTTAPFMSTRAPNGLIWMEYVQCSNSFVDMQTGLLRGPWAECISAGVRYEHSLDWASLPEYAGREGPVGGILSALEVSLAGQPNSNAMMEAAERLEKASHIAEEQGETSPRVHPAAPQHLEQQPVYGQQQFMYGQQNQGGGMSTGAKMGMAAAGGVALGAGAMYLGTHMDDVGDALGDAGQWVGDAAQDVGGFVGGAVEDMGGFVGGAVEDVGGFVGGAVDDIF